VTGPVETVYYSTKIE